jgi:hypothetical protein
MNAASMVCLFRAADRLVDSGQDSAKICLSWVEAAALFSHPIRTSAGQDPILRQG